MKSLFLIVGAVAAVCGISSAVAAEQQASPAQSGKKHFIRCIACHSVTANDHPATGPNLEGIVGRPAGSLADFPYSDALRAQAFSWDEARLDRFLQSPQADVPGLCMPFKGLAKPEMRAELIAYLKSPAG